MSYDYMGLGILTALMYVLIGLPFVRLSRWAEARLAVEKRARPESAAPPAAAVAE